MPKKTSRREYLRQQRISKARFRKRVGAEKFITKLAVRRQLPLYPAGSCAYGHMQKVADVRVEGGGQFVRSCGCAGCYSPGEIRQATPDEKLGCQMIGKYWHFVASQTPVIPGDAIIALPISTEILKKMNHL